jgi:hypothetical protein
MEELLGELLELERGLGRLVWSMRMGQLEMMLVDIEFAETDEEREKAIERMREKLQEDGAL